MAFFDADWFCEINKCTKCKKGDLPCEGWARYARSRIKTLNEEKNNLMKIIEAILKIKLTSRNED